jgi:nicotinamide-nucleotide amidase
MLATKVFKILKNKKLTVAAVESMTAGYLSYLLTKTPGSSNTFKGSFVVYSLDSKNRLFKLPEKLLKKTQGVSKEIAAHLAEKIRKKLKSNIGISIVGFADAGAKKRKKAGTVFIAISNKKEIFVTNVIIDGTRDKVRKKAAKFATEFLYQHLKAL